MTATTHIKKSGQKPHADTAHEKVHNGDSIQCAENDEKQTWGNEKPKFCGGDCKAGCKGSVIAVLHKTGTMTVPMMARQAAADPDMDPEMLRK